MKQLLCARHEVLGYWHIVVNKTESLSPHEISDGKKEIQAMIYTKGII